MIASNPVLVEYDNFLATMASTLENKEATLCSDRIETIRKRLFENNSESSDETIKRTYQKNVPEIFSLIQKHIRKTEFKPPYKELPTPPEGLAYLQIFATAKAKKVALNTKLETIMELIKKEDFDLALDFIKKTSNHSHRDFYLELYIKHKYSLNSSTPCLPEELKELLKLVKSNDVHSNILGELIIFPKNGDPILQNPKVVRELAYLYRDPSSKTKQQLMEIAAKQERSFFSYCFMF